MWFVGLKNIVDQTIGTIQYISDMITTFGDIKTFWDAYLNPNFDIPGLITNALSLLSGGTGQGVAFTMANMPRI